MRIDTLNELDRLGLLTRLFKEGFMTEKIKTYYDTYLMVNAEMKIGNTKTTAVTHVADELGVAEQTVWNALRFFKA